MNTTRHEIAHFFLGDNSFHTGGAGAGYGTFLSDKGGYSILASWNANLNFANGWDRWRLGWKDYSNAYYISAKTTSYAEVDADLMYGQTLSENEFILRDFATYGDAIRIKLPYLQNLNSNAKNQYLWIENHQILAESVEYDEDLPVGIRINIEVGNDNLGSYSNSTTNYISPLSSFGNFDFTYQYNPLKSIGYLPPSVEEYSVETQYAVSSGVYEATTSDEYSNPLTGNNLICLPGVNFIDPNGTSDYDKIYNRELLVPKSYFFNGDEKFTSYPEFGNEYDAFSVGSKLNIGSNPSSTPLLTYETPSRGAWYAPNVTPHLMDNRYIYLNGLSIEILEQKTNGDVRLKIIWNYFDVDENVRWCGPIVLIENINLQSGHTILLDQGLTPNIPLNPIIFKNQKIFAEPTKLICRNNSQFTLESKSCVDVVNNSTIILESGSELTIEDGALLSIQNSGTLQIKNGATINIEGSGQISIKNGGYICIESGAILNLDDIESVIRLESGFRPGLNPFIFTSSNCNSNLCTYSFNGSGRILCESDYSADTYIQNKSYSSNEYVTGANIFVGYDVTSPPYGNVMVNSGINVVFDASKSIDFENGFEVQDGGEMETRSYHLAGKSLSDPFIIGVLGDGDFYSDSRNNSGYGNNYSGPYNQSSEDIFYQFNIQETATVTISLCESLLNDTYLHLLDGSGNHIESNDNNSYCSGTYRSYIQRSLSEGTYLVVIEGHGTSTGVIDLELSISY